MGAIGGMGGAPRALPPDPSGAAERSPQPAGDAAAPGTAAATGGAGTRAPGGLSSAPLGGQLTTHMAMLQAGVEGALARLLSGGGAGARAAPGSGQSRTRERPATSGSTSMPRPGPLGASRKTPSSVTASLRRRSAAFPTSR